MNIADDGAQASDLSGPERWDRSGEFIFDSFFSSLNLSRTEMSSPTANVSGACGPLIRTLET